MRVINIFIITLILLVQPGLCTELSVYNASASYNTYDEFLLSVNVNQTENFTGFQYDIVYDPAYITKIEAEKGPLLFTDGFLGEVGNLIFGTLLYENEFTEPGTLNTITFMPTGKTGMTEVGIANVTFINNQMEEVFVNVTSTPIIIDNPPVITQPEDETIYTGSPYSKTYEYSDPDNDPIETFWIEPKPDGAYGYMQNGTFHWDTPTPGNYTIGLTVGDEWLHTYAEFNLTVVLQYWSYDINQDRIIDIIDLTTVANNIGKTTDIGDVNNDGIVDIFDLVMVANNFGDVQNEST